MVDADLVTRKMVLIARDLAELETLSRKALDTFLESRIDQVLAERYLERVIGRMIDINFHLLTEAGHPPPPDYYQSFVELVQLGVLEYDFARSLAACAGLRNRLVHEYDEINPVKIHEAVTMAARDIPVYLARIDKHLGRM